MITQAALHDLHDENCRLKAEVASLRLRVKALEQLADTDTLTPLPNRRAFMRRLEAVTQHAVSNHTLAAVLYIDLDGLKRINDDHGHNIGDAVLIHVANALHTHLGVSDMVARIGGDEFGAILEQVSETAARAKAKMLADQFSGQVISVEHAKIAISVTVGVAMVASNDTPLALVERADAAMYANRLYRSQT